MKNFYTRTLTGAIYVSVVIGSILAGKYVFFTVFAFIMVLTLLEFYRLCRKKEIYPQLFNGILISVALYTLIFFFWQKKVPLNIFLFSTLGILMVPFTELFRNRSNGMQNIAFTFTGVLLISIPFSTFNLILAPLPSPEVTYLPHLLIGMMVIIWASDSGAYIVGSLIGKHKLAEKISPNKTWEGTLGGIAFGAVVAIVFFSFFKDFKILQVILLSVITAIAGIFGDLTESLIKRNFEVKDSGRILPGHGGLFDRFDSMLFAAPIYYAIISMFLYN